MDPPSLGSRPCHPEEEEVVEGDGVCVCVCGKRSGHNVLIVALSIYCQAGCLCLSLSLCVCMFVLYVRAERHRPCAQALASPPCAFVLGVRMAVQCNW